MLLDQKLKKTDLNTLYFFSDPDFIHGPPHKNHVEFREGGRGVSLLSSQINIFVTYEVIRMQTNSFRNTIVKYY